jgi:hypothetical protein
MNGRNQPCWTCAITVTLYVQSLPDRKEKDFSPCRLFPFFLRCGLSKRNKSLSQANLMVANILLGRQVQWNEKWCEAYERERETGRQTIHHPQSLDQMRENLSGKIMSGGPHAKRWRNNWISGIVCTRFPSFSPLSIQMLLVSFTNGHEFFCC